MIGLFDRSMEAIIDLGLLGGPLHQLRARMSKASLDLATAVPRCGIFKPFPGDAKGPPRNALPSRASWPGLVSP
jgi:hypothetical protein